MRIVTIAQGFAQGTTQTEYLAVDADRFLCAWENYYPSSGAHPWRTRLVLRGMKEPIVIDSRLIDVLRALFPGQYPPGVELTK